MSRKGSLAEQTNNQSAPTAGGQNLKEEEKKEQPIQSDAVNANKPEVSELDDPQ